MPGKKPLTVDEYIDQAPDSAKVKLIELRNLLREVAPQAIEAIKWGIPVMEQKRILFSYAAFKHHINFMPTGPSMQPFMEELAEYKKGKDTIQFPYDKPLPVDLIKRMATYRLRDVLENDAKWMY